MPPSVIGLDIGGANLKMAHAGASAVQRPFALWKQPDRLTAALADLLRDAGPPDRLAVTMTGELCDCYETKRQGVHAILDAVQEVAGKTPLLIWTTESTFVDPATARRDWLKVAAANWLATAAFAARFAPHGAALLVDCGSTTTDIVPLWQGRPAPLGLTDPDRLKAGELVYTGARRTPVCALLDGEGAAELFATTQDVYLLLGLLAERPADRDTADGRPATRAGAHARLSRMLGGDPEITPPADTFDLARRVADRQAGRIRRAAGLVAARLPERPGVLITAGSGEFLTTDLARAWPDTRVFSLGQHLGEAVSQAACAFAIATLAAERIISEP